MPVEIRLPTVLRPHAGGQSTVSVDGSTIGEVLQNLVDANPGMKGQVLTRRWFAPPVRQRLPERRRRPLPRQARHQGG